MNDAQPGQYIYPSTSRPDTNLPDIWDYLVQERRLQNEYAYEWPGIDKRRWRHHYAETEIRLLEEFNESLRKAPLVHLQGYVSRVGGRKFILRPGLAFSYGILCNAENCRYLPADHEFVELSGYRMLPKKGDVLASDEIMVENVRQSRLDVEILKQEIGMNEAADSLLGSSSDAPAQLRKDLIISLTSSPSDPFRMGGLTATLLPLEDEFVKSQINLLDYIVEMLPGDLTSKTTIEIPTRNSGKFKISPFPWDVMSGISSKLQKGREVVLARQNGSKGLLELSIGISAETLAPKNIDEVWIKYSDLPSFIAEDVGVPQGRRRCRLELAKYLIVSHLNRPVLDTDASENGYKKIVNTLVKLRREYDSDGYAGLIDLDTEYGTPRAIVHLAKALARADGRTVVDDTMIGEALRYFLESRRSVFELWNDRNIRFPNKSREQKARYLSPSAKRILRFILDRPNSIRAEIRENFPKISDSIFEQSLATLVKEGLIYRTSEIDEKYAAV